MYRAINENGGGTNMSQKKQIGRGPTSKELDADLADRLDGTLDIYTKRELQAESILDRLSTPDETGEGDAVAPSAEGDDYASYPSDETEVPVKTDGEAAVTLATIVFRDGDCLEFLAVPADGEIGLVYIGENARRCAAVSGELFSPLRLYCSLAPPKTPLPWLLAAIDKQPDRVALVGNRQLCDDIQDPLLFEYDTLRLRVPGLQGGWWHPDSFGIGGFCGVNGKQEWRDHFGLLPPGPFLPAFTNIYKFTSELSEGVTHNSTLNGVWRRRKTAFGRVVSCSSPTRITHHYRKLGFFAWKWKEATTKVVGPDPANANAIWISAWLGFVKRRRRIIYKREGAIGGFRAFSRFAKTLTD